KRRLIREGFSVEDASFLAVPLTPDRLSELRINESVYRKRNREVNEHKRGERLQRRKRRAVERRRLAEQKLETLTEADSLDAVKKISKRSGKKKKKKRFAPIVPPLPELPECTDEPEGLKVDRPLIKLKPLERRKVESTVPVLRAFSDPSDDELPELPPPPGYVVDPSTRRWRKLRPARAEPYTTTLCGLEYNAQERGPRPLRIRLRSTHATKHERPDPTRPTRDAWRVRDSRRRRPQGARGGGLTSEEKGLLQELLSSQEGIDEAFRQLLGWRHSGHIDAEHYNSYQNAILAQFVYQEPEAEYDEYIMEQPNHPRMPPLFDPCEALDGGFLSDSQVMSTDVRVAKKFRYDARAHHRRAQRRRSLMLQLDVKATPSERAFRNGPDYVFSCDPPQNQVLLHLPHSPDETEEERVERKLLEGSFFIDRRHRHPLFGRIHMPFIAEGPLRSAVRAQAYAERQLNA
ncbi:MAG: hypothetical protein KVP17_003543, partial [Porospora cf. gigantea B]